MEPRFLGALADGRALAAHFFGGMAERHGVVSHGERKSRASVNALHQGGMDDAHMGGDAYATKKRKKKGKREDDDMGDGKRKKRKK